MRPLSFCLADCPFSFQITDSPDPTGAQSPYGNLAEKEDGPPECGRPQ